MSNTQMKAVVDQLLTPVSSAYVPKGALADLLLPPVPSKQYTGKLGGYGMNHLRLETNVIAGKGKYRQVSAIARNTTAYEVEGHGLSGMVTKQDYANVTDPFDAEKDEVMGLTSLLLVEKDYTLAQALGSTSILTQNTTLSGTSQFSDFTNSDPVSVFLAARKAVRAGCGLPPDSAIMDWDVAETLRYHPQLLDVLGFKQNRVGGLNDSELAKALGVRKLFIAEIKYNSAKEGQTAVLANCWGKHVVFAVIPDKAEKYQVSLGYNIRMEGGQPRKVYKQTLFNPPDSTEILVEDEYDMLLSNAAAAYLIKDSIA